MSDLSPALHPRRKRWQRRARNFAIAYFSICLGLWLFQRQLIFHPSSTLPHTPSLYHLPYEDVWLSLPTQNGKTDRINGWWIPAKQPNAPVLLYFHHNAVNIGANVSQARRFHDVSGCSVFLFDYRGFGLSEGDFPSESQVYQDAEAAWNYLVKDRKIPPKQIFIYGHSVGGAVAIDLASKHPEAAGLIVQSAFTSMRDMTKRFGLYWIFPLEWLLNQKFESLDKIPTLKSPVLFIHGTDDPQIPVEMGRRLYAAAPEPKQLIIIPKAGHDNNMADEYHLDIQQFMQKVQTER